MTMRKLTIICYVFVNLSIMLPYSHLLCVNETSSQRFWTKDNFPNPQTDIYKCGRCKKSWICDPNHILSENRADKLDQKIEEFRTSGYCGCTNCNDANGYTIAIALVDRIDLNGNDVEISAKNFPKYLRKYSWKFGTCNDGIVIFLSRGDRKIFTNVGENVEKQMTYECIQDIYLSVKSKLTDGKFADGLDEMIDKYQETLKNRKCAGENWKIVRTIIIAYVYFSVFTILIVGCVCSACVDRKSDGCCGRYSGHGGYSGGGGGCGGGGGGCGGGGGGGF